jgi:phosphoribosylpyrophosphate synthetase
MHFLHPNFSHLISQISDAKIVRFEQFSDGWPRIFLDNRDDISGKEVSYIGDFRYVGDLFSQIAFLDGVMRYAPASLHIYVPFFPAASMERDTPSGELSIAHVFARIFGIIGERHPGRVHIHIYDIHDEREIFYFPPSLQIHHHTTTNVLLNLLEKGGAQKPIILFPDAGAKK